MSDKFGPGEPTAVQRIALAEQVAELAVATPGVVKLEPTIRSAVLGLRSAAGQLSSLPATIKRGGVPMSEVKRRRAAGPRRAAGS